MPRDHRTGDTRSHLSLVGQQGDASKGVVAAKRIDAARKRRMVVELRCAGLSEEQIAQQMTDAGHKMSQQAVSKMLKRAMENLAEREQTDARLIRQLDLERINQAMVVLWPKVKMGDLKAMREYRQFIDQRARLLGTYAAQKHEVNGNINHVLDPTDREEVARLEEAFMSGYGDIPDAEVVEEHELGELPSPSDLGVS